MARFLDAVPGLAAGAAGGGYDLVTGRMQAALDGLANARAFPLIG